jgi:uncharacterized damage-inducible protein DinB
MQTLLTHLETSRKAFLDEVAGLTPEQCAVRPSMDAWSILEVVEHIATVEIGILEVFRTRLFAQPCPPEYKAQTAGKDQLVVDAMKDRTRRRISPDLVKPAGRWPDASSALQAFDRARIALMEFLREEKRDLRNYCAPHPALKALDGHQWILFIVSHTDRHREQIADLKAQQ